MKILQLAFLFSISIFLFRQFFICCCWIMKTALIVIMVVLGCVFMASVLMMSPKGGIGLGIGGFSAGGNEYGSKKSIEGKLKIIAMVSGILFGVVCAFMPFVN